MAPYYNVLAVDPELTDPDNGDYRPASESPAIAYGCQTFGRGPLPPTDDSLPAKPPAVPERAREIEASGVISEDTIWSADLVRVTGDVTVADGATLTVEPGACVEFQGFHRLAVDGALVAVGRPDARIVFTTNDPSSFTVDHSTAGSWSGIRFDQTPAANVRSRLEYCVIEYSKAIGAGDWSYSYGGGAISAIDFSNLVVENCIIRNNVADYGGAIFLYRNACPVIAGCLIVDNHALQNGGAIYSAYSYPEIVNNTIVRNRIHNEENPYIESAAVLGFLSKCVFSNNIIRGNPPDEPYMHAELWGNKGYYTSFNNVEGGVGGAGNIDAEARFMAPDPPTSDFRLQFDSPCIDAGSDAGTPVDLIADLNGWERIIDGDDDGVVEVDMGVYEYFAATPGDLDGDGDVDLSDLAQLLSHYGVGGGAQYSDGDLDGDGDVDLSDLAALLSAYGTHRG